MVAMQIAQLTPLMREGILLCYAKIPGDPETLKGDKQGMAQKIYNILSDSSMVYKFHTAAIITKEIFMPMYDAAGLNHHTNFGGSGGLIDTYHRVLGKLDAMVEVDESGKADDCTLNPVFFQTVLDAARAESDDPDVLKPCKRHIKKHVQEVKEALQKRFDSLDRFYYRVAHVTEERWLKVHEHGCYLKVPTKETIAAAKALLLEWDAMDDNAKQELPEECRRLFEQGFYAGSLRSFRGGTSMIRQRSRSLTASGGDWLSTSSTSSSSAGTRMHTLKGDFQWHQMSRERNQLRRQGPCPNMSAGTATGRRLLILP